MAEVIEIQMALAVDQHLEDSERENPPDRTPDRRNGCYRRTLLTGLGDIRINVPRTRQSSPCDLLQAYARREPEIDRVILAGFVLGLSTRKLGEALLPLLGRPISPATISRVTKTLDGAVAAFHERPLGGRFRAFGAALGPMARSRLTPGRCCPIAENWCGRIEEACARRPWAAP